MNQTTAQTGAISQMPQGALLRTDETIYLINDQSIAQSTRDAYRTRNIINSGITCAGNSMMCA